MWRGSVCWCNTAAIQSTNSHFVCLWPALLLASPILCTAPPQWLVVYGSKHASPHITLYFFSCICSSHLLNVRVITISLIFNVSSTKNRVCPWTVNGLPSGSIPLDFPENVPVSYQCAYTQLLLRPRPHVGLKLIRIVCVHAYYLERHVYVRGYASAYLTFAIPLDQKIPAIHNTIIQKSYTIIIKHLPIMKLHTTIRMCT